MLLHSVSKFHRRTEPKNKTTRKHNSMKNQKGRKLNEEQKAQRAEIVICVTDEERQALFEISRRKLVKQHPAISQAAHWALRFALCHPEQLLNWASGLIRYEQAEGLNQFDLVGGKIEMAANHLQEQWVD